jgi:hypothetical protein
VFLVCCQDWEAAPHPTGLHSSLGHLHAGAELFYGDHIASASRLLDPVPFPFLPLNTHPPALTGTTGLRRGRGAVTCVTASNDVVLVATARGYLLRYSWDENGNEKVP